MDEQSAKIILIEEDLRKEFRILEEENKKTDSNSLDNSIVAAVIKERDELKEKYDALVVETTELQENAVQKARDQLRNTPEPDDNHMIELKQLLDDQQKTITSLEEEIKRLQSEKLKVSATNNVSQDRV